MCNKDNPWLLPVGGVTLPIAAGGAFLLRDSYPALQAVLFSLIASSKSSSS